MCPKLFFGQAQRSKIFRTQNEITERGAVTEGKVKILSPRGSQDNAFSGRQMGFGQVEFFKVCEICMQQEAVKRRAKRWGQPQVWKEGQRGSSSGPKVRVQTDGKTRKKYGCRIFDLSQNCEDKVFV